MSFWTVTAVAAADCTCKDAAGKPVSDAGLLSPPPYSDLKQLTGRLREFEQTRKEIVNDRRLMTKAEKDSALAQCFAGPFKDIAKFVQVKDVSDISYDAYWNELHAFFARHKYEQKDVMEIVNDLDVYKDLKAEQKKNPYKEAQNEPKIVAVDACELAKLHEHEVASTVTVQGMYDPEKNTVYYNKCMNLQTAAGIVVHELAHAYLRTEELDKLKEQDKGVWSVLGRSALEGGRDAYVKLKNDLRYKEELDAYLRGAKADRELMAKFPFLEPQASSGACGDTNAWAIGWQKNVEGIEGPGGYPKAFDDKELARVRKYLKCPAYNPREN